MKTIAIDGRALQTEPYTGVSYYLQNILKVWKKQNTASEVKIYFNQHTSWTPPQYIKEHYKFSQSKIPSKLLQFLWSACSFPSLASFVKEDTIWLPNSNYIGSIAKKRLILSIHDLSFIHFPEFYSKKMRVWHTLLSIEALVKKSNHIITFSNASKQDIIEYFHIKEDIISVIPHGVDEEYFNDTTSKKAITLPLEYIAFIGSIEPRKNVGTLVEAFELLADKHPNLNLVIAGGKGWLSKEVFRKIRESKFNRRIHYKGYVTEEGKKQILKNAKVFAFPSFYEGFGLPVLEAMASGCPVVVGATGSLPELVNTSGILINPHQTSELAEALELLITNSTLASQYSNSGKQRAKEYSWDKSANKTLDVLKGFV